MKKLIIAIGMFYFPFSLLRGQTTTPYTPSILLPSPNAASLMKFSDVPVSTYTGTADVTVPIYTIKSKGITVPVSLSYHTGGIRLSEEASWVGLGWALNAGGMISRTIMGEDDFGTGGINYFTNLCPQLAGDISQNQSQQQLTTYSPYYFDFWCNYEVATSSGMEDFTSAFSPGGGGLAAYDMEPDIFSYNFAGHSGKFILTRAGAVVMQKQENIRIQFQGSSDTVTFRVTDDQGNQFYFNTLELAGVAPKSPQITSWLLSKIVTQQQDSILFNYTSGGATTGSQPDAHQTYANYCTAVEGLTTSYAVIPAYANQTLQSIDFPAGHLQFDFDSVRSDLYGAFKLDSVLIYSKNAAGTLTYLKQDNLYYSYFNGGYGSIDSAEEFYRLRLDSVKEASGTAKLPPYAFTYNNPNPGLGTEKHAFNIDHWGYYNGASNWTLIPTMSVGYNPSVNEIGFAQVESFTGANRAPSFPSMEIFSLQQVAYPTGGKTQFTYQPNDYDYSNSTLHGVPAFQYVQTVSMDSLITITSHGTTSGTIDLTRLYPVIEDGEGGTNVAITVGFRYLKNDTFPYSNTSGKLYFEIAGTDFDIHTATCAGNVCTASFSTGLVPGVYTWSGYIDGTVIDTVNTFAGIYVGVQYQETQTVYNLLQNNSEISPGAGLRIQNITNYKDATSIASEKVYNYNYLADKLETGTPQQYSYGRLMSLPSYARYWVTPTSAGGYCTALALYSSTITGLTSAIQGNIVGYDQVTETSIDPLTGQDIGKTVYQYYNNPDTAIIYNGYSIPGVFNMGDNLTGSLLSKKDYADYGGIYSKVSETDYFYHTTNRSVYYSPKYQFWPSVGAIGTGCSGDSGVESQTSAWFYPSIKSERVLMDSTVSFVYSQQDTTQFARTRNASFYDNPVHYQVTRSSTIDSKGDTLITKIKYPQDYIPFDSTRTRNTILDSMIGRNMVGATIEKQDSFYYPGSSAGYVTGAQLSLFRIASPYNTIVPDRSYKLAVNSPVTNFQPFAISGNTTSQDSRYRQMISFDQYDSYNNIQQYTPVDQDPVTIVWDYLHMYPIAQVKNAALADVAATSFEADGTGNWTYTGTSTADTTSITGSDCYNLGQTSGNITKSGLTSGTTYVLSYWTKNSSALSITGTISGYPIAGKTINGWTYYEHKLTGQTSLTVSGSGYIDELRLYPANAQMTTFTYSQQVGTTTTCDVDNKVTYYFYDGYQRLLRIKDQDGNIIKTFQYHYANQHP